MTGAMVKHLVPLQLPRLAGTRAAADALIEPVVSGLRDAALQVFGQDLIDSSPSFTDQLLKRAVEAGVDEVVVFLAPSEFSDQLDESSAVLGFRGVRSASESEIAAL